MAETTRPGKDGNRGGFRMLRYACLGLLIALVAGTGCTRKYYRTEADKEVAGILKHKDRYPIWKIAQMHVYPDPRARFADPTNPDKPPKPPDDPATRDMSPNPQHPPLKGGVALVEGSGYIGLLAQWDALN